MFFAPRLFSSIVILLKVPPVLTISSTTITSLFFTSKRLCVISTEKSPDLFLDATTYPILIHSQQGMPIALLLHPEQQLTILQLDNYQLRISLDQALQKA